MCQLVKQIAPNIDEWLNRYSQGDTINSVQAQPATKTDPSIAAIVQRLEKLETGATKQRSWRGRNNSRFARSSRSLPTCGLCLLKQATGNKS